MTQTESPAQPAVTQAQSRNKTTQDILTTPFVIGLCLIILAATIAPRALSFLPAVAGVLGYVSYWIIDRKRPAMFLPPFLFSAAIVTLAGLSAIWAVDSAEAINRSFKTAQILFSGCFLFSVIILMGQNFALKLIKALLCLLPLCLALVAYDLWSVGGIHGFIRGKDYGGAFNPSHLNHNVIVVTMMVFPALLGVQFLRAKEPDNRLIFLLMALIVGIGAYLIYHTQSQSMQLGFLAGAIAMAFFPVSIKWAWRALFLVILALSLAAPWAVQYAFNEMLPMIKSSDWLSNGYAPHRLEIWDFIARKVMEQPWIGFGIEATKAIEFDSQRLFHADNTVLHPHNFAMQIWIEFGLLGMFVFKWLLAYLLIGLMALPPRSKALGLGVFIALLSIAATGYGLWQGWFLGLMIFMMALVLAFAEFEKAQNSGDNAA
ncbi:MAG: O-antigen ligase family protein [Alphaproteobacteria bacterium]